MTPHRFGDVQDRMVAYVSVQNSIACIAESLYSIRLNLLSLCPQGLPSRAHGLALALVTPAT